MVARKQIAYGVVMDIIDIEYGINDYIKWKWADERKIHRSRVYYTGSGRPYFKLKGSRHYLDEFM